MKQKNKQLLNIQIYLPKDPVKNYTAIVDEIAKQDENVGTFLKQNKWNI